MHPGCRLRASGICSIPCAHPLPKSPLCASVKMAFLVARIKAQKDIRFQVNLDPNFGFYCRILQQRMALTADTVRVQVAWGMVLVDCIPPNRQGLNNRTLWLLKPPVVKTYIHIYKVSDVRIQILVFSDSENGCMQRSFLKRMHAGVFLGTDARNQKGHFDGCAQRTFGQRMRARYEANPGCVQPTCGQPL